ncbi:MAG: hypothetical protein ABWY55_02445 [Microbacterium sp.]
MTTDPSPWTRVRNALLGAPLTPEQVDDQHRAERSLRLAGSGAEYRACLIGKSFTGSR